MKNKTNRENMETVDNLSPSGWLICIYFFFHFFFVLLLWKVHVKIESRDKKNNIGKNTLVKTHKQMDIKKKQKKTRKTGKTGNRGNGSNTPATGNTDRTDRTEKTRNKENTFTKTNSRELFVQRFDFRWICDYIDHFNRTRFLESWFK